MPSATRPRGASGSSRRCCPKAVPGELAHVLAPSERPGTLGVDHRGDHFPAARPAATPCGPSPASRSGCASEFWTRTPSSPGHPERRPPTAFPICASATTCGHRRARRRPRGPPAGCDVPHHPSLHPRTWEHPVRPAQRVLVEQRLRPPRAPPPRSDDQARKCGPAPAEPPGARRPRLVSRLHTARRRRFPGRPCPTLAVHRLYRPSCARGQKRRGDLAGPASVPLNLPSIPPAGWNGVGAPSDSCDSGRPEARRAAKRACGPVAGPRSACGFSSPSGLCWTATNRTVAGPAGPVLPAGRIFVTRGSRTVWGGAKAPRVLQQHVRCGDQAGWLSSSRVASRGVVKSLRRRYCRPSDRRALKGLARNLSAQGFVRLVFIDDHVGSAAVPGRWPGARGGDVSHANWPSSSIHSSLMPESAPPPPGQALCALPGSALGAFP